MISCLLKATKKQNKIIEFKRFNLILSRERNGGLERESNLLLVLELIGPGGNLQCALRYNLSFLIPSRSFHLLGGHVIAVVQLFSHVRLFVNL